MTLVPSVDSCRTIKHRFATICENYILQIALNKLPQTWQRINEEGPPRDRFPIDHSAPIGVTRWYPGAVDDGYVHLSPSSVRLGTYILFKFTLSWCTDPTKSSTMFNHTHIIK